MPRRKYRSNDQRPERWPGRSIPDEWLFELPKGYIWYTHEGNIPLNSWYYIRIEKTSDDWRWMSWNIYNSRESVMLLGQMNRDDGGEGYDFAARTPEEMREYVLTLLATEKLLEGSTEG